MFIARRPVLGAFHEKADSRNTALFPKPIQALHLELPKTAPAGMVRPLYLQLCKLHANLANGIPPNWIGTFNSPTRIVVELLRFVQ